MPGNNAMFPGEMQFSVVSTHRRKKDKNHRHLFKRSTFPPDSTVESCECGVFRTGYRLKDRTPKRPLRK